MGTLHVRKRVCCRDCCVVGFSRGHFRNCRRGVNIIWNGQPEEAGLERDRSPDGLRGGAELVHKTLSQTPVELLTLGLFRTLSFGTNHYRSTHNRRLPDPVAPSNPPLVSILTTTKWTPASGLSLCYLKRITLQCFILNITVYKEPNRSFKVFLVQNNLLVTPWVCSWVSRCSLAISI